MTYANSDFLRDYNKSLPGSFTLTQAQEKIVTHGLGPMLVSAGPGSGKRMFGCSCFVSDFENESPIDTDPNIHAQSRSWTKGRLNSRLKMMKSCKSKESRDSRYKLARNQIGTITV